MDGRVEAGPPTPRRREPLSRTTRRPKTGVPEVTSPGEDGVRRANGTKGTSSPRLIVPTTCRV